MAHDGKQRRLARLSRWGDGRLVVVPLDHSLSTGPIGTEARFQDVVRSAALAGADALLVHKGRTRAIDPAVAGSCATVVQISGGTSFGPDADAKVLVGAVEDAVRLGADAVSVHVNVGSAGEGAQLADLGSVARHCDRWGMPLLAMMYLRGPWVTPGDVSASLDHLAGIAYDLGADLVKLPWPGSRERMAEVVAHSPLPVLVAGGPPGGEDLVDTARAAMAAGCGGMAAGRRVFASPSPADELRALVREIHGSDGWRAATPDHVMAGRS